MHPHDLININHLFGGGLVAKSCPTLAIPGLCLPVSSVHGTLQARVLQWVAISFSITAESSDKMWSTEEGNGKLLQYSCLENPVNNIKRVGKIPWKRERLPTPVFWPGEFHGLYSPWGFKELDMTEQSSFTQI